MSRFVSVPSEKLESFLKDKGFKRTETRTEVVYVFNHKVNKNIQIKVYTSIKIGNQAARGCGKDAIRVCAVFNNGKKSFGIAKLPRVYRTGSVDKVLDRMLERMREAYSVSTDWAKKNRY